MTLSCDLSLLYYFVNNLTKLFFNECKNCTADHRADNILDADSDGKILMTIRNWDPKKDGLLDYSNLETFMRFLDKYVKHNIKRRHAKEVEGSEPQQDSDPQAQAW